MLNLQKLKSHTLTQRRPLGVALLALIYAALALLIVLIVPIGALVADDFPLPTSWLERVAAMSAMTFMAAIVGYVAWGLWTLNERLRSGLIALSVVAMLRFGWQSVGDGDGRPLWYFAVLIAQVIYLILPRVRRAFLNNSPR